MMMMITDRQHYLSVNIFITLYIYIYISVCACVDSKVFGGFK